MKRLELGDDYVSSEGSSEDGSEKDSSSSSASSSYNDEIDQSASKVNLSENFSQESPLKVLKSTKGEMGEGIKELNEDGESVAIAADQLQMI